jgi:hypothetical protein
MTTAKLGKHEPLLTYSVAGEPQQWRVRDGEKRVKLRLYSTVRLSSRLTKRYFRAGLMKQAISLTAQTAHRSL